MKNPLTAELRTVSKLATLVRREAIAGKTMPSVPELSRFLRVITTWNPGQVASVDSISLQLACACLGDLDAALRGDRHASLRALLKHALCVLEGRFAPSPGECSPTLAA